MKWDIEHAVMKDLRAENERLRAEHKDIKDAWDRLCHVLVGNTGLSAILEARRLRELHPLAVNEQKSDR